MAHLRKIKIRLDNYKSIASSKKDHTDREFAKKTLIDTLQKELSNPAESEGEESMDKIREDTIKRLICFLKEDRLMTPRSENGTEPAIHISVFQTLTKQTQDRLHAIYCLADKASKASEEEEQAKLEQDNCEAEYEEVHGPLADKMTRLNETYITLVDLELDHNNIRKEGNIITYEKKIGIPDNDTL